VVGERSASFWRAQDSARRGIVEDVIADKGHTLDTVPRALRLAADGAAQAALLRDSAFLRVIEDGGPFTVGGRMRRAFGIWQIASDRLERYLRLIGLDRVPPPPQSIAELFAQLAADEAPASDAGTPVADRPRVSEVLRIPGGAAEGARTASGGARHDDPHAGEAEGA
jgi:hypothetical protein